MWIDRGMAKMVRNRVKVKIFAKGIRLMSLKSSYKRFLGQDIGEIDESD